MVPTAPTGEGSEIREVHNNRVCRGCPGPYSSPRTPPHVQLGYKPRNCVDGARGHRTITCRDCGTVHYEPEHVEG